MSRRRRYTFILPEGEPSDWLGDMVLAMMGLAVVIGIYLIATG